MERSSTTADAASISVPETDQPGLGNLRDAVHNRRWIRLPRAASLRHDAIAGLSGAISNVPDGMANGALLGVSPVHGLYATMIGPAVGGALSSTQLMMITTMAAASLSASQALGGLRGEARADGLFAMVILIGVFQLTAGLLRLSRLVRFVSYSVTTGFLSGVSVLLILNQLPVVTGRDTPGGIEGAIQLLFQLDSVHLPSLALAALNVSVGTQSRWSGVMGGVWMLSIVLVFPGLVGEVPMAVLAALMIMAGISALDVAEICSVWRTGVTSLLPMLATFIATLVLSIPVVVGIGVLLTLLLFVISSANDVTVRILARGADGRVRESSPPIRLPSQETTALNVYGSLFFAGARKLEELLPDPEGSVQPAVVIRLRGRQHLGATLIEVLDTYAGRLERVGGRLYLAGVAEDTAVQLRRSGKLDPDCTVQIVPAGEALGTSTEQAIALASAWLGKDRPSQEDR